MLLAGAAAAQNGPVLVLDDVNLIDGTGAAARPHARIVIRGDRIQAVEDVSGSAAPAATVRNLSGMTVIPGS